MLNLKILVLIFSAVLLIKVDASNDASLSAKLNPLKFSNRARCAEDSKKPAQSAFVLLNNYDLGKGIYRLGKATGQETSSFTKDGIRYYRHSVVEMMKLIHYRLMTRRMPLLPANANRMTGHVPGKYKNLVNNCAKSDSCPEMDQYISSIWNRGAKSITSIDNFDLGDNLVGKETFKRNSVSQMNCFRLKKMGAMQSPLFGRKPNKVILEELAKNLINSDQYLGSCLEDELENVETAIYQFDVSSIAESGWKVKGFDYWNSMRIYLSWAFRNASELKAMAGPYYNIFKGAHLEGSLLMFANGCKSLEVPKCSAEHLTQNALRELAKKDFAQNAINSDIISNVPEGPTGKLLADMAPDILDTLDFGSFGDLDKWLKNYKENYKEAKSLLKKDLVGSISTLNTVTSTLSPQRLAADLRTQFSSGLSEDHVRQELYYLCAEFYYAGHDTYSFLRPKLDLLKQSTALDKIFGPVAKGKTKDYMDYYQVLASGVVSFCEELKQKNIWDDTFTLDREGYSKWYIQKVFKGKEKSRRESIREDYFDKVKTNPYLTYTLNSSIGNLDDVVCVSASDCARKVLESTVYLYKSLTYADTFFDIEEKIKAPNLLNPYAERVACGVYDPWFKTKSIMFNLMWDVGQGALMSTVPGMIYTRATLRPKMVTSFKSLIEDGVIQYDPKYTKERIVTSLAADFGPLLGVPCSVSINSGLENIYNQYIFAGITVGACSASEEHNINVFSADDIVSSKNQAAGCLSCQLNFETVSTSIAYAADRLDSTFFLFRGVVRFFKSLQDPDNIPWSWTVDPSYVLEAYKNFGNSVPKECVRDLIDGRRCRPSSCEAESAEYITKRYNLGVSKIVRSAQRSTHYEVYTDKCEHPFTLSTAQSESKRNESCRVIRMKSYPRCAKAYQK